MASNSEDELVVLECRSPNPIDIEADVSDEEVLISTSEIFSWDFPSILRSKTVRIQSNKNRLIEHSSYFRGLLSGSFSESRLDSISIDWNLESFLNVLRFIYGCPLDITSKSFLPLFEGALYFGVETLILQCKSWFSEASSSTDPGMLQIQLDDLIHIWDFGSEHAYGFVQELCASYLARNFMWVLSSKCFEDLPYDLLLLCIKHAHLTVDSEMHLSDGLLAWLNANTEQLKSSSRTGHGDACILDEIRISLLPLWFAAGKRRSGYFSELANESVNSIFRLMEAKPTSTNVLGDGDLSHLRIRLTEYSKRVDISGCPQITSTILLLSLLCCTHSMDLPLRKNIKDFVSKLERLEGDRCQVSWGLLPTLSFKAVQEVDISSCPKLNLEAAIECFSKSFPSLRTLKAAYLLSFKTTTLYTLVYKCPLVHEVDLTVDISSLRPSDVSVISSSSVLTRLASNRPFTSGDSSSAMASFYHIGPSLSNITKLTLEGRSDLCDLDLQNIAELCTSLHYLNLRGCISVTDIGIANIISRCIKLHSIVVCHTSFGINSVVALCSSSPGFSSSSTAHVGKKNLDPLAAHIQILHMGGCKGVDDTSLLELLSQTQMLKSLCLRGTYLTDDALYSFSGSSLEKLDVSDTMISVAALIHVVHRSPSLKCLNARGCKNLCQQKITKNEAKLSSSSYSCDQPFAELAKTCMLEEIALGWGFSYFSLESLKPGIMSLRAITVGLGGSLSEDALELLPTTCPLMESIVLYFQVISDCIMTNLLKSLSFLQTLALCYCLGEISMSSFSFCMPNMRKLKLERVAPWIANDDLLILTQNCVNLIELSLVGCPLLNADSQNIISSGWPGLVSIHLEDCGEMTAKGISTLFNCRALEDILLRHNGLGMQKNFILDAASKLPMLRHLSMDLCDATEGDFDIPDYADRYFLRTVKIARCKFGRCNFGLHFAEGRRSPVHKETLVLEWNSKSLVRTVVKERL